MRGQRIDASLEPRRVGSRHLLSGILACGEVEDEEHPMRADFIPAKKGQRGHWDYYICSRKKNSRDHKGASRRVGARVLGQAVIDSLMKHVLTRENSRPLADTIAAQLSRTNSDAGVRLDAARTELEQVERSIDNLLLAVEGMGLSPSLKEKLTKHEAEKERL